MAHCSGYRVRLVDEPAGVYAARLVLLFPLHCNPELAMGFIRTFILPKDVDFNNALQAQALITRTIVEDLRNTCVDKDASARAAITVHADEARALKTKNMKELLDVFIAPYDKESIYRMITQLDWITLSVRHFILEIEAYGILSIQEYQPIFEVLVEMATLLEQGVTRLSKKSPKLLTHEIDLIHHNYNHVVELCARSIAELLVQDDCKRIITHKEVLTQLKEVAKRIQVTANSLEDMAIKVI